MKELNEHCSICAVYSWGCPAIDWQEDGTPINSRNEPVITSFCFEPKED